MAAVTDLREVDVREPPSIGEPAALSLRHERHNRPDRLERWAVFAVPLALYLWIGWRLAISAANLPGDALSRVANASSAVLSRDPHLEAIGFVWSPFPTLWEVPIVNLSRWWPELVTRGFAGVIVSALLMAWMLSTVRSWLGDLGLGRTARVALVLALAVHPFIVLYGSNGMSEAGMLCFLVIAARRLAMWFEHDRALDLARAGVALAFGYWTRYEVAASILAMVMLVGWISFRRAAGPARHRVRESALRVGVIGFPPLFAMILWALVSWSIVDEPFAQFSSAYGNSQLVKAGAAGIIAATGALSGGPRVTYFAQQFLVIGGAGIVAGAAWCWWATRGSLRVVAAMCALLGPIAFQLFAAFTGSSFAWSRYVMSAVPLAVLVLGSLVDNLSRRGGGARIGAAVVGLVVAAGMIVPAMSLLRSGDLTSGEERGELASIPVPYGTGEPQPATRDLLLGERVASEVDALHPRRGEVLTDTATAFAIVLNAHDQTDYVIPADRDFERIVADPGAFGVRYVLVPDPGGTYNAINAEYPSLFADGGGIATLRHDWDFGSSAGRWRLYELNPELRKR